jgi:hypothetical protein
MNFGILEQSMWAQEPSCRTGPPAYVAWWAGMTTLFLLGSKIPAQVYSCQSLKNHGHSKTIIKDYTVYTNIKYNLTQLL